MLMKSLGEGSYVIPEGCERVDAGESTGLNSVGDVRLAGAMRVADGEQLTP
jgi:hypothetical protein